MNDKTTTNAKSADKVAAAVDTAKKTTDTVIDKAVATQVKAINDAAASTKTVATKTAKRAKRTTAKVAKAQKKTVATAAKVMSTPKNEEKTMTNFDMNSWFGGYDVPNADKVEELMANAGKQGEEFIAKSRAATEELAEMAKANVEAVIEAARIAANGAKDLGTDMIENGRGQFERNSDNLRLLAEAKTPADFMSLQSELAKSSFDRMISESAKLTERMVKLAGDAMQPVSNRASVNAEKVKGMIA